MTKTIKNLIEAEKEFNRAKAALETARLIATEYVLKSGYEEVSIEGYKVKIKETKSQKVEDTEDINNLQFKLDMLRKKLIEKNKNKIYDLQKKAFYIDIELNSIVNNDMTSSLEAKIDSLRENLKNNIASKYEISCRFNNKAAQECVNTRQLKEFISKGSKLKDDCSKVITKGQVLKFLLQYQHEDKAKLDEEWMKLVERHRKEWCC